MLFGLSAMCALHQGQLLRARALADVAMVGVRRTRWPTLQLRYALIGILDVYLEEPLGALPRETAEALAVLRRTARYFVLLRPAAALYQGRYALRCGHWLRAYVQLQRSLRAAEKYNVRFEQASAHYWLGRLAQNPVGALLVRPGAAHHFHAASTLFASLDATWEVALARRALLTDAAPTADGGRIARPKILTWLGQLHLALRNARSPVRG